MILLFIPLFVFLGTLVCTLRSLGLGLLALFAVGYVNGVVRANFLSVYTTFMFDAALAGLYLGFLTGWSSEVAAVFRGQAGKWVLALIAWPSLLSVIPVNHYLVQLVALRATVWFLPVLLIASRLRANDLTLITRGLALLNLGALAGGIYVYLYGVESLYPFNAVTEIIYKSNDVAGYQYHRIPSTFLSAHAYGGAMLFTLPFLLDRLFGHGVKFIDRSLAAAGVLAAIGGILMCAARQPIAIFGIMMFVSWGVSRFNMSIGVITIVLIGLGVGVAASNERLQRAATLEDTEAVSERMQGSANENFLELMSKYPAGAGLGSSVGTSIPYFLQDRAPTAIGLENEYCRIMIDQSLFGLGLWLAFLIWLLYRPPPLRLDVPWGFGVVFMYALVLTNWMTAFLGTGTLSAIPGSVLLLTQMGVLARVREVADGTAMKGCLIVTGDFTNLGGMDRANLELALFLAAESPVHLVTHRADDSVGKLLNVTVHRVPRPFGKHLLGQPLLARAGRKWASRLARDGYRVIVNGGNCLWPDVNWVHHVHAADSPHQPTSRLRRLKARVERPMAPRAEQASIRAARVVICNSERTRRDVIEKLGVKPERSVTVYLGVDPARYSPAQPEQRTALRSRFGWPGARPIVLFIGALGDRRKGFDTLFAAWQSLCKESTWDAVLGVIGHGAELPAWEARAVAAGLTDKMRFLGFRTDVPDLLRGADALVHPARYEAYGLGVHEALCCGLPAIVSSAAGVSERYPAELGDLILQDPESPAELAERLRNWRANLDSFATRIRPFSDQLRSRTWADMAREFVAAVDETPLGTGGAP